MLNYVTDLAAAIYAALTAIALSAQALAPVAPWHASMMLSAVMASIAAITTWAMIRAFRKH